MNQVFRMRGLLLLLVLCVLWAAPAPAAERAGDGLERTGPTDVLGSGDVLRVMQQARGKVVLLNFWASWCAPCRAERPELVDLRKAFPFEDLLILGLSVDHDPAGYAAFVASNEFNYPVRRAGQDVIRLFKVGSIPRLMVYDPQGRLAQDHEGLTTAHKLKRTVLDLLQRR